MGPIQSIEITPTALILSPIASEFCCNAEPRRAANDPGAAKGPRPETLGLVGAPESYAGVSPVFVPAMPFASMREASVAFWAATMFGSGVAFASGAAFSTSGESAM
jgi:hypothetical protein